MRTIAVAGRKGGTGKTTSAVNISGWLAKRGHRVLLIDLDPQANSTSIFKVTNGGKGIYDFLVREVPLAQLVHNLRPHLDILTGSEMTTVARETLDSWRRINPNEAMRRLQQGLQQADYDYVLIDCAPALDILIINALVAADEVAMPVTCQKLGTEGADQFVELTVDMLGGTVASYELKWIIPTFYRPNVSASELALNWIYDTYGTRVTDPVRLNTRLDEANYYAQTIFEYDDRCSGAIDYAKIAGRIDYGA